MVIAFLSRTLPLRKTLSFLHAFSSSSLPKHFRFSLLSLPQFNRNSHSSTVVASFRLTLPDFCLIRDHRCFSTRPTTSSLNDPSPNWCNRSPKETILLNGCDFKNWLMVMEPPPPEKTKDDIIDSYFKMLAMVVGRQLESVFTILELLWE